MVVPYIVAQMLGAFLGGVIVWLAYRRHFEVTENSDFKLLVFCTEPALPIAFLSSCLFGFRRPTKFSRPARSCLSQYDV